MDKVKTLNNKSIDVIIDELHKFRCYTNIQKLSDDVFRISSNKSVYLTNISDCYTNLSLIDISSYYNDYELLHINIGIFQLKQ